MKDSLGLVFQYFFTAGAGIGAGLVVTVGGGLLLYSKFGRGNGLWAKNKRS